MRGDEPGYLKYMSDDEAMAFIQQISKSLLKIAVQREFVDLAKVLRSSVNLSQPGQGQVDSGATPPPSRPSRPLPPSAVSPTGEALGRLCKPASGGSCDILTR